MKGTLYIVATPIGNLKDITLRAIEILGEVDLIAAEDTRHTLKLLNHFEIKKKLISLHKYSEEKRYEEIIEILKEKSVALVSDAGTPTISDPGYELVKKAIENNIEVISVPGACAAITALSLSGMPLNSFAFYGFLDVKKVKDELIAIKDKAMVSVIYESPKRLKKTLKLIWEVFNNVEISVSRELTKKFEETIRGSAKEVYEQVSTREEIKGEIVIIIDAVLKVVQEISDDLISEKLSECLNKGMSNKDAVKTVADMLDVNKNKVYTLLLSKMQG